MLSFSKKKKKKNGYQNKSIHSYWYQSLGNVLTLEIKHSNDTQACR